MLKWTTDIEDNIDAIRDQIYEKIKNMTTSERTSYFNNIAENAKNNGCRIVKSAIENQDVVFN